VGKAVLAVAGGRGSNNEATNAYLAVVEKVEVEVGVGGGERGSSNEWAPRAANKTIH
jgi:hypothetical protein